MTDPMGNQRVMVYDDADRVITRLQRDTDGNSYTAIARAIAYDAADRVTQQTQQGPDGDLASSADNLVSTWWYDAQDRVTQTQDPAGMEVAVQYDALDRITRQVESAKKRGRESF